MSGAVRRSLNRLSMLTIYIVMAPNTDMVTMFAVSVWPPKLTSWSLKMATMPTTPPASTARCGVWKRGWILASVRGRKPSRARAKIWRE
jgi:hypothetical protein